MSNILRNMAWPVVATLLCAAAACQKEAAPVDFGKLEGKPTCAAIYTLTGAEDVIQQNIASITDTVDKLGRQYFIERSTAIGQDGAPEMVSLDINKTSAEALQLRVTYLKSCNNIDDASQRALSFMHAGNASWKLPDGVRFTLTSSTETPFTNADSLPTGAPT